MNLWSGTRLITSFKGGLISESFSVWLKSAIRDAINSLKEEDSEMAPFFRDLSQSENCSDIKPPLAID